MASTGTDRFARAAEQLAVEYAGEPVHSIERFDTGLRNWVYDVSLSSGTRIVVRIADPVNRAEIAGGIFWHQQLEAVGVAQPQILAGDAEAAVPYTLLERLPGTDLGNVFEVLSPSELREIAESVAEMQQRASSLPTAAGFGYARSYDGPFHATWLQVLEAEVDRADRWIRSAGVVDPGLVARVSAKLRRAEKWTREVSPTAFLHDATTKNVIVHNGRVSGLVDVDQMAFGDPLWTAALTRMSLLASGLDPTYAEALASLLARRAQIDERFDLYTSLFCLTFLGELGQQFNNDAPVPVDPAFRHRLQAVLDSLLERIN